MITSIRFRLTRDGLEQVVSELSRDVIRAGAGKPGERAAHVVTERDLSTLRLDESVVFRGVKHKAKPLSVLLLGFDRVPVISGNYDSAGQLIRSVRTLLENAVDKNDSNVYVIGASDKLFRELATRASLSEREESGKSRFRREGEGFEVGPGPDVSSLALLELLPRRQVPDDLVRTFIGKSPEIELVRQLIIRAAQNDEPVLVLGDTGTGKEVIARSIHKYSQRCIEKFVPVNCGAIPRELFESELFGHPKFAFTDAKYDKKGLWEVTGRGSLFLDEIGDLSLDHQVKILRALQESKIRRIGESREVAVSARVIAATNRDLFAMVQAGQFREDLYYRLRSFQIRSPSLRNHCEDIPTLANHFWRRITGNQTAELPEQILGELRRYRWPGNVRELKAVLMSCHTLFGKERLGLEHLRAVFQLHGQSPVARRGSLADQEINLHRVECLRHLRRVDEVIRAAHVAVKPVLEDGKSDTATIESIQKVLRDRLRELEVLCARPLMFYGEVTFSVVHRVLGKLAYFDGLMSADVKTALGYWKKEVVEEYRLALSAIFNEAERLTSSVSSR